MVDTYLVGAEPVLILRTRISTEKRMDVPGNTRETISKEQLSDHREITGYQLKSCEETYCSVQKETEFEKNKENTYGI